jgi:tetratricopeptide (TPR) repeat protein
MALCHRAILNRQLRKFPDAISDATKAIEVNPRSAIAYESRGTTYSRAGDDKQAVSDFSRAIEIDAHYALAYVGRGDSMSHLGKYEDARKDLQTAVEIDASLKELVKKSLEVMEIRKKYSEWKEMKRKSKLRTVRRCRRKSVNDRTTR